MNELITIGTQEISGEGKQTVNARDMHSFLEVKKDFSNWIKKQIERARLIEGRDFIKVAQKGELSKTGQITIEYFLTLEAGKHIAMLSGTEKGFEVREYFIECEKAAKTPIQLPDFTNPAIAARAWADEVEQKQVLQLTLQEQAPKVQFAETVQASTKAIKIGDFVKLISNKTGFVIGRNNFFEWLRFEKIIERRSMPFQRYIDNGWFEVKEATYENINTNGPQVCFTTLVTGFGQVALLERFKKSETFKKFLNKSARGNSQRLVGVEATV